MFEGKVITINRALGDIEFIFEEIDIFVDLLFGSDIDTLPLKLAVGEMLANSIKHSTFKTYRSKKLDIIIKQHDDFSLNIKIIDTSDPFNPIAVPTPNLSNYIEEKKLGNMGIFIVKKIIDKMHYEYVNGQNMIELIYYFNKPELRVA